MAKAAPFRLSGTIGALQRAEKGVAEMNKTSRSVVIDFRLALRFERVQKCLAELSSAERLDKPLAFFASPGDRHLPIALINRTIRDLANSPLAELQAVPGIGPKKLGSLFDLMERAAQMVDGQLGLATSGSAQYCIGTTASVPPVIAQPSQVSEAEWEQWRAMVRRHQLNQETLGRFTASLHRLPRTLWQTRLEAYLDLTLAELREQKSHGEKRISAILEVFADLHKLLLGFDEHSHLSVCLLPRFAIYLERWLARRLQCPELPSVEEIEAEFISPLLEQLSADGNEAQVELVRDRLNSSSRGVGHAARRLGLARGRAYELLGDVAEIMEARWPEGNSLVSQFLSRMSREGETSEATARMAAAAAIFFRRPPQHASKCLPLASEVTEPGNLLDAIPCAT